MYLFNKRRLFPWLALLTGAIGFALRSWLLSTVDQRGLLPKYHIAGILTLLLLAFTLGVLAYVLQSVAPSKAYRRLFPPSTISSAGIVISAVGLGISAFTVKGVGALRLLLPISGILCVAALTLSAYCRLIGLRPNCLLHGIVILFFIFRTLVCCQAWGSEPQLQLYFFPLLASLFLVLASYCRAEADAVMGDYRRYMFFGQAALFCCCLCLAGKDWLFYLSGGIWAATDYCRLPASK